MATTGQPGTLFNIQRYSTEDGPGIRTSIFLKGCPMHCPWCHNPESIRQRSELVWHADRCIGAENCVQSCPREALMLTEKGLAIDRAGCDVCGVCVDACLIDALEILGRKYSAEEVAAIVLQDQVFYNKSQGGMTLSGGEPSMQSSFCLTLMEKVKKQGVHIALDTCCGVNWNKLSPLVDLADLVLIDLKTLDEAAHLKFTGIPLDLVLDNAARISEKGKAIWVRTPVIPGYTAGVENIKHTARFIRHHLPTALRYDLLAFNNYCASKYTNLGRTWELDGAELLSQSTMVELSQSAKNEGLPFVKWSGLTRAESS